MYMNPLWKVLVCGSADVIYDTLISPNLIDDFRMCIYSKVRACAEIKNEHTHTTSLQMHEQTLCFVVWSSFSDKIIIRKAKSV